MWLQVAKMKKDMNAKNAAAAQAAAAKGEAFTQQKGASADAPNPIQLPAVRSSGAAEPGRTDALDPARRARVDAVYKLTQGDLGGAGKDLFDSTRAGQIINTWQSLQGAGAGGPSAAAGAGGATSAAAGAGGPSAAAGAGGATSAGSATQGPLAARAAATQDILNQLRLSGWF